MEEFSRETGDKNTLSHVDKLVIALGMTLSRDKNEYDQVNKTPQNLEEFRPKAFKKHYDDAGIVLMRINPSQFSKQMMAGQPQGAKKIILQLMSFKMLRRLRIRGGLISKLMK